MQNFYLPGSPKKIGKIQETLQRLQRSAEGWQLADALLGSNDDKVRFFGALTFTIKINQDWSVFLYTNQSLQRADRTQGHFKS